MSNYSITHLRELEAEAIKLDGRLAEIQAEIATLDCTAVNQTEIAGRSPFSIRYGTSSGLPSKSASSSF